MANTVAAACIATATMFAGVRPPWPHLEKVFSFVRKSLLYCSIVVLYNLICLISQSLSQVFHGPKPRVRALNGGYLNSLVRAFPVDD